MLKRQSGDKKKPVSYETRGIILCVVKENFHYISFVCNLVFYYLPLTEFSKKFVIISMLEFYK